MRKKVTIHDALAKIKECITLLPGEDEKQKIVQEIREITTELDMLRNNIDRLPEESEKRQLSEAIHTLESFLDSLHERAHLADIFHVKVKKTRNRKTSASSVDTDDLLKHLESIPTDHLMEELSKQKKNTLLELSSKLSITTNSKQTKDILVDKIFKLGFANRRGYDLLSERQS